MSVLDILGADACAEARRGMRAAEQLRAQLIALAGGAGTVRVHSERAWASISFSGTRHKLVIRFEGEAIDGGEAIIDAAPEHEYTIPGQLVADISVIDVDHRQLEDERWRMDVTIDALLLDEG